MTNRNAARRPVNAVSYSRPLRPTLLAMCIGAVLHSPAWSQDEGDDLIEEVVVRGTRASLESAQQIKRNADTFVDAISATDINALPDVSVLETLQRVPGITIERFAAVDDPDHFSTEGSGATLRGLPQTRSAFNGRDSFSANSNRGLSFQDVPPELMGSVKIFKNQTADMVEGGISGTIDLNTRKPFDSNEENFQLSTQGNYGDIADEFTPSFSALYSDRFETSGGEFGVLFSFADSDLEFQSDGVEFGQHFLVADAAGPGMDRYIPINGGIRSTTTERDRQGATAALQYRNNDDTFNALFEYIRSDSQVNWLEHAFFSDDQGGSIAPGASFDSLALTQGTLTNLANGLGPQTRRQNTETLVEDFSFKMEFRPTDRLSFTGDFQYVDATTDAVDLSVFAGLMPQGGSGIDIGLNLGSVPDVSFSAPPGASQTDAEYFNDPSNYFWRAAMDHLEESEGDQLALRFDGDYELESDWARSVEAGVRFAERDQTTRWSTYNWGNLSEAWNGGFATFAGDTNSNGAGSGAFESFTFDDFHGGNAGGLPGNTALFPDRSLVENYEAFLTGLNSFNRAALADRGGVVDGFYLPAEINQTSEENNAAYVKLNFGQDGDNRWEGNVGFRYVKVDTEVAGGVNFQAINDNTAAFASAEEIAFGNGFNQTESVSSDYSTILPSLNFKYEFAPDVIGRFAYSQAIAFPDLGNLRYNYAVSARVVNDADGNPDIIGWQQSSGNPFLEPMEADNFDASVEWYFNDSGFFSAGLFYKDIKNFFATDTVPTLVTNPQNGVSQVVDINQPINIGEASLTGVELAYQQFFDNLPGVWSGLGVQINYTYLDADDVPNQNNRPVQADSNSPARTTIPFDNLPLQGLSEHSYNIVGLFQNEKIDARLAYNWRDDYLLTIRQVNLGLPVFADDRGQLDGSIFYNFSPTWQIGLQASNLLKDEQNSFMQVDEAGNQVFRSSFVFDRRFSLIFRARF